MDKGKLYIYRGLPGTGKSTAARKNYDVDFVFEADQYFQNEVGGEYWFDPAQLGNAHRWCLWKTQQAIDRGYNVAVANTFTQLWEMKPYFDLTPNVFVIRCTGPFRTVHDVPDDVIKKMSDRFEDYEGETYL